MFEIKKGVIEMKFKINNIEWDIEKVPRKHELLSELSANGVSNSSLQKIYIADDMSPSFTRSIVIHELTHAFLVFGDISNQARENENKKTYVSEEICEFMGFYADRIIEIADNFLIGVKK